MLESEADYLSTNSHVLGLASGHHDKIGSDSLTHMEVKYYAIPED